MTQRPSIRTLDKLSFRLAKVSIAIALIVGILLTLVQVYLDYSSQAQELDTRARQILQVAVPPASRAVHTLDEALAQEVVEGLLTYDFIVAVSIYDDLQEKLAGSDRSESSDSLGFFASGLVGKRLEFVRDLPITDTQSGQIVMVLSLDRALKGFFDRVWTMLLSGIIRNLMLICFLFVAFHYLVSRPLASLSQMFNKIDPAFPGENRLKVAHHNQGNELGLLAQQGNEFIDSVDKVLKQRDTAEAKIRFLAYHDSLTGLPNRLAFLERLDVSIAHSQRLGMFSSLLFIDIDEFKQINEVHGRLIGDRVLVRASERIKDVIRKDDTLARINSDEFVVLLHDLDKKEDRALAKTMQTAQKLVKAFEKALLVNNQNIRVQVSVGIVTYPKQDLSGHALLNLADVALYQAKTTEKGQIQVFEQDLLDAAQVKKNMAEVLEDALLRHEFRLFFQPIYDLEQHVVGCEMLLRWQHKERGLLMPDDFLAELEHSGMILEVSNWAIRETLLQIQDWQEKGIWPEFGTNIHFNLSAKQFGQRDFVRRTLDIFEELDFPPDHVVLELTEELVLTDFDYAVGVLKQLNDAGVQIAIDDYGTGYSSISYLRHMPLSQVKIDHSFIRHLGDDSYTDVVAAIVLLAKQFNLKTTAEGVETEQQFAALKQLNCDFAQGTLLQEPVGKKALEAFLTKMRQQGRFSHVA